MKVTKSYVVEEEQAERIERVATAAGLSDSAVVRMILSGWDGSILISVEDNDDTKETGDDNLE